MSETYMDVSGSRSKVIVCKNCGYQYMRRVEETVTGICYESCLTREQANEKAAADGAEKLEKVLEKEVNKPVECPTCGFIPGELTHTKFNDLVVSLAMIALGSLLMLFVYLRITESKRLHFGAVVLGVLCIGGGLLLFISVCCRIIYDLFFSKRKKEELSPERESVASPCSIDGSAPPIRPANECHTP